MVGFNDEIGLNGCVFTEECRPYHNCKPWKITEHSLEFTLTSLFRYLLPTYCGGTLLYPEQFLLTLWFSNKTNNVTTCVINIYLLFVNQFRFKFKSLDSFCSYLLFFSLDKLLNLFEKRCQPFRDNLTQTRHRWAQNRLSSISSVEHGFG